MTNTIDPAIAKALMPFSPMVKRLAMALIDGYLKAINSGDEAAADQAEKSINAASGEFGKAVRKLLIVIDTPSGFVCVS